MVKERETPEGVVRKVEYSEKAGKNGDFIIPSHTCPWCGRVIGNRPEDKECWRCGGLIDWS